MDRPESGKEMRGEDPPRIGKEGFQISDRRRRTTPKRLRPPSSATDGSGTVVRINPAIVARLSPERAVGSMKSVSLVSTPETPPAEANAPPPGFVPEFVSVPRLLPPLLVNKLVLVNPVALSEDWMSWIVYPVAPFAASQEDSPDIRMV